MFKPLVLALALLGSGGAHAQQSPALAWSPCPGDKIGMECADLRVPVDWQQPDGRRITLKLGRLKATGASEGSALISYGGPGGPGIGLTQSLSSWWAKLRERMDIVTWDTRGYGPQFGGLSTGLDCTWTRLPVPEFPRHDADFGRLSDTNRGVAETCRHDDPGLFAHMSSADHARDMEAIRKALGHPELNYYGASYAGLYGQAYARLFPDRIRTMVLDATLNHSTADRDREMTAMAKGNEQHLRRFFAWCAAAGDCRDVPAEFRALVKRADRAPVAAAPEVAYTGRDLRSFAIGRARQGEPGWPALAKAIRRAHAGDASLFLPERGARYPDQSTGVTECTDWPRPASAAHLDATVARLRRAAPAAGAANTLATGSLSCIGWPAPVSNPPAPLPKGLPPMLGAGAWGESDTVARVLAQVPGSVTIAHDGPGHTLYGANACARDHINRYLTDKRLPPRGTTC